MVDHQGQPTSGFARVIRFFSRVIMDFVKTAPIDAEEKIRLQHYAVLLLLGITTMACYGVYGIIQGHYVLSALILLSGAGLSFGLYFLGRLKNGAVVYRINSFLFSILLLYMVAIGGEDGSKILWMYTFPLIALFLLGRSEGLFWTTGVFAFSSVLLFIPLPRFMVHQYPLEFRIRFVTTYVIVAIIAYWFEYLRQTYHAGMTSEALKLEEEKVRLQLEINERRKTEQEKVVLIGQLQDALAKVKLLSGFLPICACCKKIRDEKGGWNQIESYIRDRSEAEFSHGYCPECAEHLLKDLPGNAKSKNE